MTLSGERGAESRLQHLVYADTNGRQVYVQGKTLPDGRPWLPKDREARVIHYPGIERPIATVVTPLPPHPQ
jgi:hypothetical protein